MRNTRSNGLKNRLLGATDADKLSDSQAMYYMSRLWSVLPEKIRNCCVYVDPNWIYKFRKQEDQQETVIKWFNRLSIFTKKYVFLPICLSNHWSLPILCNPGGEFKLRKQRPSMILLDSLNGFLKKDVEELMTRFRKKYSAA